MSTPAQRQTERSWRQWFMRLRPLLSLLIVGLLIPAAFATTRPASTEAGELGEDDESENLAGQDADTIADAGGGSSPPPSIQALPHVAALFQIHRLRAAAADEDASDAFATLLAPLHNLARLGSLGSRGPPALT